MAIIPFKYIDFVSDNSSRGGGGWIHQTSQILYHKLSALGCFTTSPFQDKNGNILIIQTSQNSFS